MPGSYTDHFYGETEGPYGCSEDLPIQVFVPAGAFATSTYLGEGYSWVNGGDNPPSSDATTLLCHDQFGTTYRFHIGGSGKYNIAPALSCELVAP